MMTKGGCGMKNGNFERTKYFVVAFGSSFLVLLMMALMMVANVQSKQPASSSAPESSADDYYLPRAEDNLNLVLIGSDAKENPARYFFLVRLDAEDGRLPVAALPPQTVVTYNGKQNTLSELYRLDGAMAVKQALSALFDIPVDRYVTFNGESLVHAVDSIGYIEYELPAPLEYRSEGLSISLAEGPQMVDGKKFYDILRYPGYANELARCAAASDLLAAYINGRLETALSPQADALFQSVVNLVDSDLSFGDYDSRREALSFLAKLGGEHANAALVRGAFNTAGDSFTPSQSTLELILRLYG